MNVFLQTLTQYPLTEIVGWALLHFLWQALIIGLPLLMLLAVLQRHNPQLRYLLASAGLLLMAAAPVITAGYLIAGGEFTPARVPMEPLQAPELAEIGEAEILSTSSLSVGRDIPQVEFTPAAPEVTSTWNSSHTLAGWRRTLQHRLPLAVAVWSTGVALLSLRLLAGIWRLRQWRRLGRPAVDSGLVRLAENLARRMALDKKFQLLESASAVVPAVIGWLQPVVIVPISLASGMSTAELESLLAHELAHIKRHDWLVNLIQTVIETILFYHPLVWWISGVIRRERENCCDDLAIATCGNRATFARALARLEEARCGTGGLAVSAIGGSLLARVRRITSAHDPRPCTWWPAGLIALASVGLVAGGLWVSAQERNSTPLQATDEYVESTQDNAGKGSVDEPDARTVQTIATWPTHKPEVETIDTRTGQKHRVMADVELLGISERQARLDMKYSNVMNYSFVPASVAKKLEAVELGIIDFGDAPPPKPVQTLQLALALPPTAAVDNEPTEIPVEATKIQFVTANELEDRAGDRTIVPYANDAIWIPDHLAFYGVNQTRQTKFRVVRLGRVNLGMGPTFGPVNALVLDDANSSLGVLGSNWARIPRGPQGEGFVWSASDGFHFMALAPPLGAQEVLATHTYDLSRRESTGWVQINGTQVPVDQGVEYGGVRVHVTLMFDVVAVDAASGRLLWHLDWNKSEPIWETVSVLRVSQPEADTLVVELQSRERHPAETTRRYHHLKTGALLELKNKKGNAGSAPNVTIIYRDGDQVQMAELSSPKGNASAVERARQLRNVFREENPAELAGFVTSRETLVSAVNTVHLPLEGAVTWGFDAAEVTYYLPKGSGMRGEFQGKKVEVTQKEGLTQVVVTDGWVKLIDATGVERAVASADGGAEQLVIDCRLAGAEYSLTMRTQRLQRDAAFPQPPVQVKINLATGAPADEVQPPHGAIRYQVVGDTAIEPGPLQMKMAWSHDLRRLVEEAKRESSKDPPEIQGDEGNRSSARP